MSQHPVGTGPFRFVNDDSGSGNRARSESEIFWRPLRRSHCTRKLAGKAAQPALVRGNVERVRFRIVPDAIVRALELAKRHGGRGSELTESRHGRNARKGTWPRSRSAAGNDNCVRRLQSRRSDSRASRSAAGAGVCDRPGDADQISNARAGAGGVEFAAAEPLGVRPERPAIRFRSRARGAIAGCGGFSARRWRRAVPSGVQNFHRGVFTVAERSDCGRMEARGSGDRSAAARICDFLCGPIARKFSAIGAALGGSETTIRIFSITFSTRRKSRRMGRIAGITAIQSSIPCWIRRESKSTAKNGRRCCGRFRRSWRRMSLISICGIRIMCASIARRLTDIVIPPAGDYDFIEGARLQVTAASQTAAVRALRAA